MPITALDYAPVVILCAFARVHSDGGKVAAAASEHPERRHARRERATR